MRRLLIVSMAALLCGTPNLHAQAVAGPEKAKSPTTARIIGIFPGAGHMYAGETGRGFVYLGGSAAIWMAGLMLMAADCLNDLPASGQEDCVSPALENGATVVSFGFYGWSIYDAGRAARRANARRALKTSLILEPARLPVSASRDGWGARLGMSVATR